MGYWGAPPTSLRWRQLTLSSVFYEYIAKIDRLIEHHLTLHVYQIQLSHDEQLGY